MCLRSFSADLSPEAKQAAINWHTRGIAAIEETRDSGELRARVDRLRAERNNLEKLQEMQATDAIAALDYISQRNDLLQRTKELADRQSNYDAEIVESEPKLRALEVQLQDLKQVRVSDISTWRRRKLEIEEHLVESEKFESLEQEFLHQKVVNSSQQEDLQILKSTLKQLEQREVELKNVKAHLAVIESQRKLEELNIQLKELGQVPRGFCIKDYETAVQRAKESLHKNEGVQSQLENGISVLQNELQSEFFESAQQYPEQKKTLEYMRQDLTRTKSEIMDHDEKILSSHQLHVARINSVLHEKWPRFYAGSDIKYIKIKSDPNPALLNQDEDKKQSTDQVEQTKFRKVYNYRVVKSCKGVETNMRDACSSGQKEIACLLIRLVLAEMLAADRLNVIALDDPNCALDSANENELKIKTLAKLVSAENSNPSPNGRLQLIVASQSQEFVRKLAQATSISHYTHVERGDRYSTTRKRVIAFLDDVGLAAPAAQDPGPNALAELGVDESDGSPTQKRRRVQPD